ncbi:hypothetical protein CR513_26521, partial [Mucuna pruriens]
MTSTNSKILAFYVSDHISIVGRSLTPIVGCDNIHLHPSLRHIPKLSNNLISIHKLTQNLECAVTFFPSDHVLHDLPTGRTIGAGKEQQGLII